MLDTYLSKLDGCLDENMSMLSSRNIELIEKFLDVRHKMCKAYDINYKPTETEIVESVDVEMDLLVKYLDTYKKDKEHKRDSSMTYLKYFMEELYKEFECISDLSVNCDDELKLVKEKIKEIFSLFN